MNLSTPLGDKELWDFSSDVDVLDVVILFPFQSSTLGQ